MGLDTALYLLYGSVILGGVTGILNCAVIYITNSTTYKNKVEYNTRKLKNEKKHKDELEKYNEELKKYCEEIKNLGLNDIEIIIKVIYDMWERIDGYMYYLPSDQKDYSGVERLYLYKKKYGVCRHFADDIAHRLNVINPKYNARVVTLDLDEVDNSAYYLPIKQKVIKNKVDIKDSKKVDDEYEKIKKVNRKIYGNHMVCLVDLKPNITLVVDPTNMNIGYIKNKHINYFEGDKSYKICKMGSYTFNGESFSKTIKDNFKLLFKNLISYEKLNEKYGPEAQEEALNCIKYIDLENDMDEKSKNKTI